MSSMKNQILTKKSRGKIIPPALLAVWTGFAESTNVGRKSPPAAKPKPKYTGALAARLILKRKQIFPPIWLTFPYNRKSDLNRAQVRPRSRKTSQHRLNPGRMNNPWRQLSRKRGLNKNLLIKRISPNRQQKRRRTRQNNLRPLNLMSLMLCLPVGTRARGNQTLRQASRKKTNRARASLKIKMRKIRSTKRRMP